MEKDYFKITREHMSESYYKHKFFYLTKPQEYSMAQTTKIPEHECAKLECPFCNREMTPEHYEKAVKAEQLKTNEVLVEQQKIMNAQTEEKIKQADLQREKRFQEEEKLRLKEKEESEKMLHESFDRRTEDKEKIHKQENLKQ